LTCSEGCGALLRLIWSFRLTNVKEMGMHRVKPTLLSVNHSICVTDVQKER